MWLKDLLAAMPEIIALVKAIRMEIESSAKNRKVKDDMAKISEAFKNRDSNALNDIFSNNNTDS